MKRLRVCPACKAYTMKTACPSCAAGTVSSKPAKYSPEDHYGAYRRAAKKETLQERGLL